MDIAHYTVPITCIEHVGCRSNINYFQVKGYFYFPFYYGVIITPTKKACTNCIFKNKEKVEGFLFFVREMYSLQFT